MKKLAWLLVICLLLSIASFAEEVPQAAPTEVFSPTEVPTAAEAPPAVEAAPPARAKVSAATLAALQNAELAAAYPTEGTCGKNINWKLIGSNTLQLTGFGDMYDYGHDESDRTTWAPYLAASAGITKLYIDPRITKIGNFAFWGLVNLQTIEYINATTRYLESIGEGAFSNCTALPTFTLPASLKTIGDNAFENCTALTKITIPSGVTTIGANAFLIEKGMNGGLTDVITLPSSLTTIGEYAFQNTGLTDVTIPEKITDLPKGVFHSCEKLTRAVLPTGLLSIGDSAFANCAVLTAADLDSTNVTTIGSNAFQDTAIQKLPLPNTLQTIGDGAFLRAKLTEITIPDSVTTLGTDAVRECQNLISANLGNGLLTIGNNAFYECKKLAAANVISPCTVGDWAFGYTGLTGLTCNAVSLGQQAYYGCSQLATVTLSDDLTAIGNGTFVNCPKLKYNHKDGADYLGSTNKDYLCLVSGTNYTAEALTLPEETRVIGFYAFKGNPSLKSVSLSLPYINYGAFYQCSALESVTLQEGVEILGDLAFASCSNATALSLPKTVKSIGDYAFNGWSKVKQIQYNGTPTDWDAVTVGGNSDLLNYARPFAKETSGKLIAAAYADGKMKQCRMVEDYTAGTTLLVRFQKAIPTEQTVKAFVLNERYAPVTGNP